MLHGEIVVVFDETKASGQMTLLTLLQLMPAEA